MGSEAILNAQQLSHASDRGMASGRIENHGTSWEKGLAKGAGNFDQKESCALKLDLNARPGRCAWKRGSGTDVTLVPGLPWATHQNRGGCS